MPKKKNQWVMTNKELEYHLGHKLVLQEKWDWHTNRAFGIEIRCEEPGCETEEPLLDGDYYDINK